VGLVAGAGFADFGHEVVCVDIDELKIARLRAGEVPIYEPGLEPLIQRNVADGRLRFTTELKESVSGADVVLIAVGTPAQRDGSADLSQVLAAAAGIGRSITGYTVVVTKSTVPVGTAEKIEAAIAAVTDVPFAVASNPEFLKEGDAVNDFMKPDRVIIGTTDERARAVLGRLYSPFVRTNDRLLFTDARSAELIKYAANSFLATKISFMNEIANACERLGADVEMVRRGMGMDRRICPRFLFPGVGYGGSCFPKDVRALMATSREAGLHLELLESVHRVNERQKAVLAEKITGHFDGNLRGKIVAVWGLSFKPGTDDTREAPAQVVIDQLLAKGACIHAHDPVANEAMRRVFGNRVRWFDGNYEATRGAHALALLTEWHQFRRPNFQRLRELMETPALFDGRNIWDPDEVRALGFSYQGIGRR
jgi:UDPglucose 6-dehydrogenase